MAKNWEDLTQAEKIEELRRDILKTMEFVNRLDRRADGLESGISEVASQIAGVARRVATLESGPTEHRPSASDRGAKQKR